MSFRESCRRTVDEVVSDTDETCSAIGCCNAKWGETASSILALGFDFGARAEAEAAVVGWAGDDRV